MVNYEVYNYLHDISIIERKPDVLTWKQVVVRWIITKQRSYKKLRENASFLHNNMILVPSPSLLFAL